MKINGLNNFMEVMPMNKERILLVIDALYVGGTETHVLGLAKELMKNNVFVSIAARKEGSLLSSFEDLKCPIHHIDFPRTLNLEEKHEQELVKKIEEIIEIENITLIHSHQTPSGYLAGKAAKNKKIATVFTVHGTYYPNDEIRKILKFTDSVICVSPPLCNYIKSFGVENPYLVPNGVNLKEYERDTKKTADLRKELNIPEDSIIVVYASRISWAKANVCSIFLRACKDLKLKLFPNLHVVIVGGGDRLGDIQNLAQMIEKMCNDSFIHIVGEQKNMHTYYSIADSVVGTGRVALEAMASEKPIIAVGNHGYYGIVNKGNINEAWDHYFGDHSSKSACSRVNLRNDLKKLLLAKEQLILYGKEARKIVEEKFNIQKVVIDLLKIYSETTGGGIKPMKKLLYIGWIGFNNLGDELLWNIFKEMCGKYLDDRQVEITPSLPGIDLKNLEKYDTVILGGGSLLLPGYLQILQNALHEGKSIIIWGSGLDWIEKHNLDLLVEDQLGSLEQNFKQKDIEVLDEVIDKALFVGVRGPLTKKAIEIMLGSEKAKKVNIIGDPGLLLQESNSKALPARKEKIIGINWGTTLNRLYGGNEQVVEEQLIEAAKKLISLGYKILIYAVWTEDIKHCKRLYEKLNDKENVMLDINLYSEDELIEKLSACMCTINFKLHANFLSLSANVPAIALGYRFKVFDCGSLLDMQHLVVSTDSKQMTQELIDRVEIIEKSRESILQQYHKIKTEYEPLLEYIFTKNLI